jgi:D-serine deaminase-like pyridoxal phosphate-dependent protein
MARLNGETLLMLGDGHCLRDQAMGFCFAAGAHEDGSFKATSLETLRNMVAAGSGITLLPQLATPKEHRRDGVSYIKWSDEHGVLEDPGDTLKLGDKVWLVPGHCDPTCNLYDTYVGVRDGKVECLWPVTARGRVF